jgi:hypothetical protein
LYHRYSKTLARVRFSKVVLTVNSNAPPLRNESWSIRSFIWDGLSKRFEKMTRALSQKKRSGPDKKGPPKKPVIIDRGTKPHTLRCPMCMGYIKIGLQYAKCDCEETYHMVCLSRTGYCPICERKWNDETVKSITHVNGNVESSLSGKMLECPSCGEKVSIYDMECKCGAIFLRDNDSFLCPECGGRVGKGEMACLNCGEAFRPCEIVVCPGCGKSFDALEGACSCGMFVGNACPECGCHLEIDDEYCGRCGSRFDMINK